MPINKDATDLEIRKENVPGHTAYAWLIHSEGYINTNLRTIWPLAGTSDIPVPATATAMTISSASANDTLGGTGANIAVVQYLDENYNEVEDVLNMNGQTGVSLSVPAIRINRVIVGFSGSTKSNVGRLYIGSGAVTSGVPANVFHVVEATEGISRTGLFTVPANKAAYFNGINVTSQSNKGITVQLVVEVAQTNTQLQTTQYELGAGSTGFAASPSPSLAIEPKTDIYWKALTGTGTADLAMTVGLYLIRKTEIQRQV